MPRGITIYITVAAVLVFLIYSINYGVNKKIAFEEHSEAYRSMFTIAPDAIGESESDETPEVEVSHQELLIAKIMRSAEEAGIRPELAVAVARCESSLNPDARHAISSATGLFQFTSPTWKWIKAEGSPLNEDDAIREFVKWFPVYSGWWKDCI